MDLAQFQSQEETTAVWTFFYVYSNHLSNSNHIGGLQGIFGRGNPFYWVGSGLLADNSMVPWNNGEPNFADGRESCMTVTKSDLKFRVNDISCDSVTGFFVCEEVTILSSH